MVYYEIVYSFLFYVNSLFLLYEYRKYFRKFRNFKKNREYLEGGYKNDIIPVPSIRAVPLIMPTFSENEKEKEKIKFTKETILNSPIDVYLVELGNYIRNDDLIYNILFLITSTFYNPDDGNYYKNAVFEIIEFFKKICMQFGSKNISLNFLEKTELYIYQFKLDIKINNDILFFIIEYDSDCDSFSLFPSKYASNLNEKKKKLIEEVEWLFETFENFYKEL